MKFYHYILLTIGILVTGMIAEGCSTRNSDVVESDMEKFCELVISLSSEISIPHTPATRADQSWGEPYPEEPGVPSEYNIDDVSLYFITVDNTVIPFATTLKERNNNIVTYSARIDVRSWFVDHAADGSPSLSGRIVAVANCPDGYTPGSPFRDIPFLVSDIDQYKIIPMWGVASVNNLQLTVDSSVHAGDIMMLRAVPKITIEMDDDFRNLYKIVSVVPDQQDYPAEGNCVPRNALNVTRTADLMMEGCFNPYLSSLYTAPQFHNLGSDRVWSYPVERSGPDDTGTPLSFTVTLEQKDKPGVRFSGKVYLCDYVDGKPNLNAAFPQLVRNHDYLYRISLKELEFVISFKEWIFGGKVHIELE